MGSWLDLLFLIDLSGCVLCVVCVGDCGSMCVCRSKEKKEKREEGEGEGEGEGEQPDSQDSQKTEVRERERVYNIQIGSVCTGIVENVSNILYAVCGMLLSKP